MPSDEMVEKVARAIKELKPFEDGDENIEYILIRGLHAIGFQLPAAGAQDLAEDIAKAALEAAEAGAEPAGDEMVEKVARAIAQEAVDDLDMFRGVNGDAAFEALMALSRKQARAALAAAEATEQPSLASYVSPNVYDGVRASPPSEVSRDERAAIRAFLEAAAEDENVRLKVECAMSGRHWSESARLGILALKEAVDDLTNATAIRARGET